MKKNYSEYEHLADLGAAKYVFGYMALILLLFLIGLCIVLPFRG